MRCYMLDTHRLDGIVTITATSFQRVDGQLVLRELSDDYIVIGCQIPTFDEILGRWRAYKTLKQHTERLPLHTARRCRHSQLQCIPVAVKQVFVRACQGMMSFVHHNHPRYAIRLFQIPDMPAEPLDREHKDSYFGFQHHFFLPIVQAESVQCLLHLFYQFTAVCNNPHLTLLVVIQKSFHHRSHHVGLSRTRRHLHDDRVTFFITLLLAVMGYLLRVQHVDDFLQHLLLIIIKLDFLHSKEM